jgi:hypothetical protein
VPDVKRNVALLVGAALGTIGAVLVRRRTSRAPGVSRAPASDPRAEELRRKLAEAREQAADEDEFEAAGMTGEALVEDEPRPDPETGEVDEERRRVHEEARAAAEEMRRSGEPEETRRSGEPGEA